MIAERLRPRMLGSFFVVAAKSESARLLTHSAVVLNPCSRLIEAVQPNSSFAFLGSAYHSGKSQFRPAIVLNLGSSAILKTRRAVSARSRMVVFTPVPILKLSPYSAGCRITAALINASQTSSTCMKSREVLGSTNGGNFPVTALRNKVGINRDVSSYGPYTEYSRRFAHGNCRCLPMKCR